MAVEHGRSAVVHGRRFVTRLLGSHWFNPFRNAGVLAVGRGAQGLMALIYVILASRALGAAEFGVLILLHTLVQFVTQLLRFQSWQAILRFGAEALRTADAARLHRTVFFASLLDVLSALLALTLLQIFLPQVLAFIGMPDSILADARWYVFSAVFLITGSAPLGVLRLLDRHDLISWQTIVEPLIRLIGSLVLSVVEADLLQFLQLWFLATIAGRLMLFLLARRALNLRALDLRLSSLDARVFAPEPGIWRFSIGTNLASSLNLSDLQIGPLLAGNLLGLSEAGLYRIAQQVSNVVIKPLNKLLVPAIYSDLSALTAAGNHRLRQSLVSRSALLAGAIAVLAFGVLAATGQPLIIALFGVEFSGSYEAALWFTSAGVLAAFTFPLAPLLISAGRVRDTVVTRLVALAVYLVSFYSLVPGLGLRGAGITVVAHAFITLCLLRYFARPQLTSDQTDRFTGRPSSKG